MRGVRGGLVLLVVGFACTPVWPVMAEEPVGIDGAEAQFAQPADAGAAAPSAEPPAPTGTVVAEVPIEESGLAVRDVSVEPSGTGKRVRIQLTRTPDRVTDFALNNPPRLVIDLRGPRAASARREARFPLGDTEVPRVRVAPYRNSLRVVLDLSRGGQHAVRQEGNALIADLGATGEGEPERTAVLSPMIVEQDGEKPATIELAQATEPIAPDAQSGGAVARPPAPPPAARAPRPVVVRDETQVASATQPRVDPVVKPFYRGQRISLDFKDADIQNVLRVLADVSGMNIIATDDVKGKVTLHLQDVPWDQALDLVLRTNRLEKTQEDNVVRISSVNRLKEEREAQRAAQEAATELEPLRVAYIRVNYARADDQLIDKVKGVLTDRGSVTFDDRTNTIIVRDITKGISDATTLIRELDVQSPQVLIEAQLVEADETLARALGVQWGYRFEAGPATGNPTGSNFPGTVGVSGAGLGAGATPSAVPGVPGSVVPFLADFPVTPNFGPGFGAGAGSALNLALGSLDGSQSIVARLTALEQDGKARVISRPRVVTMNNVAATIESLDILRVKLPSTGTVINTGAGGAAGSSTVATEKINTGIILVVTPQVSRDGYVLMNIFAKASRPDFSRSVDGIPAEISRQANSNVLVHDGETVVLGGIFLRATDDSETGIPWLMRAPVIGWLFKRTQSTRRHAELIVFVTPKTVVTGGVAVMPPAEKLWEQRKRGG